jgi:pimeloyl-ACP methyl ester carboxylesterase
VLGILALSTEITFWTLTLLTFLGVVIYWHHFAGTTFTKVFGRVSILILVQILAIASIGLTLNRANDFFATWGDLFGINNNLAKVAISPANLSSISAADVKAAEHTKGGSLIFRRVITGEKSGVSDYVYLVTSPSISRELESTVSPSIGSNYKVVEFLHGYPGVPQTWIGTLDGIATIERLEASKKIIPTISIIPSINVVRGLDTECLNIPGTSDVETWLTSDMKAFAQKFIGVDDRKWATFGYSTGGWCATILGLRHQDQYDQAISIAGYFEPSFSAGINQRERKILSAEYDLSKITNSQPNNLKLLVIYSKRDRYSFNSMNLYLATSGTFIDVKLVEMPNAGHNTKSWKPFVSTGLEWLGVNARQNASGSLK